MSKLASYRKRVASLARLRAGTPFPNGTAEHAKVLIEHMFANANQEVCILTGSLNPRIYGADDIVDAVVGFVASKEHKLQILAEDFDNEQLTRNPLTRELLQYDNFELKVLSQEGSDNMGFHFIVMDDDSYRFEYDKEGFAAIAAFGDTTETSGRLRYLFDTLWGRRDNDLVH